MRRRFFSKTNNSGIDYSKQYFTIEVLTDGTVTLPSVGESYYRLNDSDWVSYTDKTVLTVSTNDFVSIKALCETNYSGHLFASTSTFNISGNIMSLVYGDDFIDNNVLPDNCFMQFFSGCSNLINAENLILPNTTSFYCYYFMFASCTSLITAPKLPSTILTEQCYVQMFNNCTSLIKAPDLLADTLVYGCYYNMFNGCSNLNYIKMLATDVSDTAVLYNWVKGVASTGTFVKHPDMNSLPSGNSGIPTGWTVENAII